MEQAIVAAFAILPDRSQLHLLGALVDTTDWSMFGSHDLYLAALGALADDLAEAEGWGGDAGALYLGRHRPRRPAPGYRG